MITRRQILRLAGSALGCRVAQAASWRLPMPSASIKSAVAGSGILVGTTIGGSDLADRTKGSFIVENFSMITPGTAMKWAYIHPEQDKFAWTYADSLVAFAKQNSLAVHGHNLCWNRYNPGWVQQTVTRGNARSILESHVQTVATHFRGQIDTWDVVNEPVKVDSGLPGGFMPGPWYDNLGPDYLDIAFHTAASADPRAIRQLNIDNVEQDSDSCEATRQAELAIIRAALKRGVPIQAVGIESHIKTYLPVTSTSFCRFISELRGMGLAVNITELDVDDGLGNGSVANRLQAVADYYARYLEEVVPLSGTKRVGFWTLSDKNNQLDASAPRKDHTEHRPGLLDDNYVPNPAYYSVQNALKTVAHQ
jgi:endo-1,4-beta-xylanase